MLKKAYHCKNQGRLCGELMKVWHFTCLPSNNISFMLVLIWFLFSFCVLLFARVLLKCGGNDVTRLFHYMLKQISFPYRECNLKVHTDWELMNSLKESLCQLQEVCNRVPLINMLDFVHDAHSYLSFPMLMLYLSQLFRIP